MPKEATKSSKTTLYTKFNIDYAPLPPGFADKRGFQFDFSRKAAAAKESRGGKAKKDKNAPKRALSAYMFFSQDWRERVKAENPDAGFGEIGKLLGTKWKELSDEEKKPYAEQAERDRERADKEKKDYDKKKAAADSGSGDGEEDDDE